MFDWLINNPILVIVIISVLYRLLFGRNDPQKKAERLKQQQKSRQMLEQARVAVNSGDSNGTLRQQIEQAIQAIGDQSDKDPSMAALRRTMKPSAQESAMVTEVRESALPTQTAAPAISGMPKTTVMPTMTAMPTTTLMPTTTAEPTTTAAPMVTAAPTMTAAPAASSTSNAFAFRSLRGTMATRAEYDNKASFEYHSASAEPVEKEYHMTGFKPFAESTGRAAVVPEDAEDTETPHEALMGMLSDGDGLRRAVLIHEILGPPRGLKSRR